MRIAFSYHRHPPRCALFDLHRQGRQQRGQRQVGIVEREAAGNAQVRYIRSNPQMPAAIAPQFVNQIGQAYVVDHQHAAGPGIGTGGQAVSPAQAVVAH
ncbi:hypothetical protein D3C84_894160 [compost metagenome]